MRIFPALRRFNTVSFSLLSILAIAALIAMLVEIVRGRQSYNDDSVVASSGDKRLGEQMDAGDRILTLYSKGELNGDCQRDLFFIDSRDGSTVRFGNDPNQVYCNGQMVGRPGTDAPKSYGYFALAMVNGRSANSTDADEPLLFDAWFIRFSDMKQFRIAESARAVDGPNELDGNQFSAIVWDKNDHPRFVIFDSAAGRITVSKELDLEVRHESEDSAKLVPAPRNKFHSMRPM